MTTPNEQHLWEEYRDAELHRVEPVLAKAGYTLDHTQVHTGGERYLTKTRDVGGGGLKLVLTGTQTSTQKRVIIKASSDPLGIAEIERERTARTAITKIPFARYTFKTPEELLYLHEKSLVVSVTAYIEQERALFEHTLDEQFFLALRALEAQEGVHMTTLGHKSDVHDTFGTVSARDYLAQFTSFKREALAAYRDAALEDLYSAGETLLSAAQTLIERYSGFLTHADFVTNNLRVAGRDIYLLDYSSIHFGNKYESWARFINFMVHHNPSLERLLTDYVRANRGEEEYLALRLMRIYKLGFLLSYYAQALSKTEGNLREITLQRLTLWSEAMRALIDDRPIDRNIVDTYVRDLEVLRSDDEKARQKELLGVEKLEI